MLLGIGQFFVILVIAVIIVRIVLIAVIILNLVGIWVRRTREFPDSPGKAGYPYSHIVFNDQNRFIRGWLIRASNERGWVIISHGLPRPDEPAGAGQMMSIVKPFLDQGISVVLISHMGFAPSDGDSVSVGQREDQDILNTIAHMHELYPDLKQLPLFLCGFSMGAGTVLKAAFQHEVAGVIAGVPFLGIEQSIRHQLRNLIRVGDRSFGFPPIVTNWPIRWAVRLVLGQEARHLMPEAFCRGVAAHQGKLQAPVLVIQAMDDEVVPQLNTLDLREWINHPIVVNVVGRHEQVRIPSDSMDVGTHFAAPEVLLIIENFLKQTLED